MFVDEVVLDIEAGKGGNGCMAFRREKYIEMGGPWGGNGGKGSDILFEVDEGLNTLLDLRYKRLIKGTSGANGLGKGKHGKNAEDIVITVPPGTVISDIETGYVIADLTENGEKAVIASGGRGGRGNIAFATHRNPAPNYAENGEPGEQRRVKVELKLLADVGLVGLPSVGKSTFISKVSASRPKIAAYHFTTLKPNLGVTKTEDGRSFVIADLPGLIKGASLGEGLGDKFLKHIERTRVIAHIIDMSGFEGRDPYEDYVTINQELASFNKKIIEKPQIIIANKMDMPSSTLHLEKFKEKVDLPIYPISAAEDMGISDVLTVLADKLDTIKKEPLIEEEKFESHVLYKFKEEKPFTLHKDGNVWSIRGKEVEKVVQMTKFSSDEAAMRFATKLRKMGIDDALRKQGAQEGDTVRILDIEFEYKE
ncbi:MAG: GTPase ObgE [Bacilli bacterium]|nr:GTPase ObgE [Bacilli bacterium]